MNEIFNKRLMKGISTIEIIVVVVLVSIITAIAIPNYRQYVANNKAVTLAAKLTTAIQLAKSEAIHRNLAVKVCALASAGGTTCNDIAVTWDFGWQVIVPSTSEIIRSFPVQNPSGVTPQLPSSITFSSSGLPTPNVNYFAITPDGCTQGQQVTYDITLPGLALKTNPVTCIYLPPPI